MGGWRGFALFLFVALLEGGSASAQVPPPYGRFVGILRHESLQRDQLAKLDFIASREDGNTLQLAAVLTLHFGDFRSGEYVAYHFENVRYLPFNQSFVFHQKDQPITITTAKYDGTNFVGDVQVSFDFPGGSHRLILRRDGTSEPELPLIEPVWGEYRGRCRNRSSGKMVPSVVQLQTYRSPEAATLTGDAFRAYRIRGQFAEESDSRCAFGTGSGRLCHWGNFTTASYNFYDKLLKLTGVYRELVCSVEPDGLQCNDCEFLRRVSPETKSPRAFSPPRAVPFPGENPPRAEASALSGDTPAIAGMYRGFVYHEYLGRYQPVRMNLMAYQAPAEGGGPATLRMSANATIYFGERTGESITYKFRERVYPLFSPQFTLAQMDLDVDAILQVTSIGHGVVRGVWYSQLFGRVGSFLVRKDGPPPLPKEAALVEKVGGTYEGNEIDMNLQVVEGSAGPNSENAFSPLLIRGWMTYRGITRRLLIPGGTYDFYTGRISIEQSADIVHVGQRTSRRLLQLLRTFFVPLSFYRPLVLEPFRLVEAADES